jgi:hypothetical protein
MVHDNRVRLVAYVRPWGLRHHSDIAKLRKALAASRGQGRVRSCGLRRNRQCVGREGLPTSSEVGYTFVVSLIGVPFSTAAAITVSTAAGISRTALASWRECSPSAWRCQAKSWQWRKPLPLVPLSVYTTSNHMTLGHATPRQPLRSGRATGEASGRTARPFAALKMTCPIANVMWSDCASSTPAPGLLHACAG